MAKVGLQFHAERHEIVAFVRSWAESMQLHVVGERYRGDDYWAGRIALEGLVMASPEVSEANQLFLTVCEPPVGDSTVREFLDSNSDLLSINIGERTEDSLRESFMGVITEKESELKVWRRIRREATMAMKNGVWIVNPISKVATEYRNHYYTIGASRLAGQGVRMLAAAGWNEYHFSPPSNRVQ